MGQVQEKVERTWRQNSSASVKDGGKEARDGRVSDGVRWKKRVMEAVQDFPEKIAPT